MSTWTFYKDRLFCLISGCINFLAQNTTGEMTDRTRKMNGKIVTSTNKVKRQEKSSFLAEVVRLLWSEDVLPGESVTKEDNPVVRFQHPEILEKNLCLDIPNGGTGVDEEKLLSVVQEVIRRSVKTSHPNFHNQLYGGLDPYGLAGSWITETLNTNQFTYEVAPAFTLAENAVLKKMLKLIGFPESGDGIFTPGGSISNMYGMVLARHSLCPEARTKGLSSCPPLIAFASEDCHYSLLKGANWLGLGTENVVSVKTDEKGRMAPEELEKAIQRVSEDCNHADSSGMNNSHSMRAKPFLVLATAGTTVLGSFDPLEEIAEICSRHGLWLHVDACWGGSLLFSKTHRHLLNGIERADSVSWNPHKMLGAPLQCSAFLVRHKGLLHKCNSAAATYLFQQDKFYDATYDTGDKSVQCGRKVDAFKLWMMWAARGDEGFRILVDNALDCARYFLKLISNHPGFKLVLPSFECTNICFWFIPPRLRGKQETPSWWDEIDKVAPKLKERMIIEGTLMLGYQPIAHKNLRNFIRLVLTCHPPATYEHIQYIVKEIERLGEDL